MKKKLKKIKKELQKKNRFLVGSLSVLFIFAIVLTGYGIANTRNISFANIPFSLPEKKNYMYLSDMNYITDNNWSFNGWSGHEIQKDKNQDGGTISLKLNDEKRYFAKGIGLHARGQVTYDISELSIDYPRFVAKLGLESTKSTVGTIWFQIFVSNDGTNWESKLKTDTLTSANNAVQVDIDVEGYKYLRIYVDPVGSNASDHGNIADAKFVTKDYEAGNDVFYDRLHKVEYYDEIIGEKDLDYNYNNNFNLILERELVNKFGFWNIQYAAETNTNFVEVMDWILNESRVLQEVIEVGEISNGSLFLEVLSNLYHQNKEFLKTENGYVYEKMMIGLAAAYSTDRVISPLAFSFQSPTTYDYMERFSIMKELFDNEKLKRVKINALAGEFVQNEWFKDFHVELMRMVMQDGTSNIDLKWLNGFTNEKQSVSFYMIGYVSPVYGQDKYYAEENRQKYDEQFYLSKYNVPYGLVDGKKVARYWMVFANGGICWNASRVGQSMYRVNGLPATGAYQPGHELYIQYYQDANGNGYWTPRYGNWGWAGSTWGGSNPYRYIFNWNNKYFTDKHISGAKGASSTGYLYLGQANLNRLEQYQKSLYYNLIANSYTDRNRKLDIYKKALEVNDINLDTYDNIINLYKEMSIKNEGGTITSTDWYKLANKILEAYNYYPVAMSDLLNVIRPYLEGSEKLHIDRLEKEALLRASKATANETIQVDGVRTHANQLLNKAQPDPMTFSFDGENGGKIVKNPIYSLAWGYSLDGGKTFTDFKMDDSITLSDEEIASITAENDIIINFMGLKDYRFTIDIVDGTLSNLLYGNDLENRVVGIDLTYEWRNSANDSWTSYKDASPNNTGNKTLEVRRGATGNSLPSTSQTFTFTEDNQPNTRKYVPVSHLSIESFSTESIDAKRPYYAPNAIDGNGKTLWHTDFRESVLTSDIKPFITIKLDKERYISAVEFKQLKYRSDDPIDIKNARIYISEDGEKWVEAGKIENCPQNEELRVIDFTESIYGKYIKIEMDTYGIFAGLSLVNVFQDMTKNPRPTAGIGYSTTEPTKENVVARLINVSVDNYKILSPGGDTHIFTENGEFTFEFVDENGTKGTALAKVDWIDRIAPTATIEYSTESPINSSVFATLKPNEDIKVTNNGYYSIDEEGKVFDIDGNIIPDYKADKNGVVTDSAGKVIDPLKYEFIDNGEFTFEFVDKAGNSGTATAKVSWIDFEKPSAALSYSKNTLTNEDVTVTISFDENAKVLNNNGNKTYTFTKNGEFTFEFSDLAGNRGTISAKVDWIDKIAPTATLKYEKLADKVIVTVVNPSEEITYKDGIGVYTFTKNGNYEIEFYDKAGNVGKLTAVIDSLKNNGGSTNPPVTPDDNKPTEPTTPDDNKPGTTDPNTPDNNKPGTTDPSTSDDNKPGTTNPSNPNKPGNTGKPNTTTPGTTNPINTDYKQYSLNKISVEVPNSLVQDGMELQVELFALNEALQGKFGNASEYYNIYFEKNDKELEIATSEAIKISIKRTSMKKFIGVYEVTEDNTIKLLDYNLNGNNIEVIAKETGKYVISYSELDPISPTITIPIINGEQSNNTIWILASIGAVILGVGVYIFKTKGKK